MSATAPNTGAATVTSSAVAAVISAKTASAGTKDPNNVMPRSTLPSTAYSGASTRVKYVLNSTPVTIMP